MPATNSPSTDGDAAQAGGTDRESIGHQYRLGVDIGGTFTDATLIDEGTGAVYISKSATTPKNLVLGFKKAARAAMRKASIMPCDIRYLVHATTVATNSIIEGQVATTAFITTSGFRDLLEIARQVRPTLYDLMFEKPQPLVPRDMCFEVAERIDASGRVLVPLNEQEVRRLAAQIREQGVETIAVCFLHSYLNPAHETRVGEILAEELPEVGVSLSSSVAPEIREYVRASTTVINASIKPTVSRYLRGIEAELREMGVPGELLVMQSSGGVFTFPAAIEKPVFMVESGPAAGVIAANYVGDNLGYRDIMSFDMGGTTAKAGLIQDGRPRVTKDYEVGSVARSTVGGSRAAGYPIRTPVIDLVEVGAGGGSIAWIDSGGTLRVGPQSAGADPGPVCYSKGGEEPTVTDANLVLGRLNPAYFLGGEIRLDIDGARRAIEEKCAQPLGMDAVEAAHGIVEIANAAMVNALRLVSVQRGLDPRDFALVAFGGAGPLHANRLAEEIEVPLTVIPISPGATSAIGLLVTDLTHDYATSFIQRSDVADLAAIEDAFRQLEEPGRTALEREGVKPQQMLLRRQLEMRYVGQSFELLIPLPESGQRALKMDDAVSRFHEDHQATYGTSTPDGPVEIVNLRVTAVGRIAKPKLREIGRAGGEVTSAQKATRQVFFSETRGMIECPIYDRYALGAEMVVAGPAVVEEADSTTVIHPGYEALVDRFGNLLLSKATRTPASRIAG